MEFWLCLSSMALLPSSCGCFQKCQPQLSSDSESDFKWAQEGRNLLRNFFPLVSASASASAIIVDSASASASGAPVLNPDLSGTGSKWWKYSPPSLHRLSNSGQPPMVRRSSAGNRWRRPFGNSSIPGQSMITNSRRELSPSIPSATLLGSCSNSPLGSSALPDLQGLTAAPPNLWSIESTKFQGM